MSSNLLCLIYSLTSLQSPGLCLCMFEWRRNSHESGVKPAWWISEHSIEVERWLCVLQMITCLKIEGLCAKAGCSSEDFVFNWKVFLNVCDSLTLKYIISGDFFSQNISQQSLVMTTCLRNPLEAMLN